MRFLLVLLALAAPVAAQTVIGPSGAGAGTGVGAGDASDRRGMERVEAHIRDLHGRLGIQPAQEGPWAAFAAVMRENAQAMQRGHRERQGHLPGMTAVDDMRSYAALSRLHAENVDRLLPVFESLYGVMTPEQRVAADRTFQQFQRNAARGARL